MSFRQWLKISDWFDRIIVVLVIVLFLVLIAFVLFDRTSAPSRTEYEGRVVDKWASFAETTTGSDTYYRLLIEDKDGRRFRVAADADIYEKVKVGMWIRHSKDGSTLSW